MSARLPLWYRSGRSQTKEEFVSATRPKPQVTNTTSPNMKVFNILMMGPSGVGKTTFINAFANYIKFESLEHAEAGNMEILIQSFISLAGTGVEEEYEFQTITIGGAEDQYENFSTDGQSATQLCRSFVFRSGDRILRLIDTPGIADSRGLEYDTKNLQEILTFISQFNHLNAICILAKPNEERLSIQFQYCVKELLRHLHASAAQNLVFLFTNARQSFYRPARTKSLLEVMFKDNLQDHHVNISITKDNTFTFDNEAFRYLAIRKKRYRIFESEFEAYQKSWKKSAEECLRFLDYVTKLPEHNVQQTLSLNKAQQLIQKLPRPIAETLRLIEENIQLAQQYERRIGRNSSILTEGIPQNVAKVHQFTHPRTVCASTKCTEMVKKNGETRVKYKLICHDECYLKGVVQERLKHPKIQDCEIMDPKTDECTVCRCDWEEHIHLTYEYATDRTYLKETVRHETFDNASNQSSSPADVHQHIKDLQLEAEQIKNVYKQLAEYLQVNAMCPINYAILHYLDHMIHLERNKPNNNDDRQNIVTNLERIKEDYKRYFDQLKKTFEDKSVLEERRRLIRPEYIINLVETLYALSINGKSISDQMTNIASVEYRSSRRHEREIILSRETVSTPLMIKLEKIFHS